MIRDINELNQFNRRGGYSINYPSNTRRLFSPDDDIHGALIYLIKGATISLAGSFYGWDDKEINELFIDAWQKENLPVQLCLDSTQAAGKAEKSLISEWPQDQIGNRLVIGQSRKHAINHTKIIVIDGEITIDGSTNFSDSGESKQNNSCVITFDSVYAAESRSKVDMTHDEMLKQMQVKKS